MAVAKYNSYNLTHSQQKHIEISLYVKKTNKHKYNNSLYLFYIFCEFGKKIVFNTLRSVNIVKIIIFSKSLITVRYNFYNYAKYVILYFTKKLLSIFYVPFWSLIIYLINYVADES